MTSPEQEALRDALHRAMRDLSQDGWLAGWVVGLEYLAWGVATGAVRECEFLEPHELEPHRVRLRALSEACSGWWAWPSHERWPVWVPMAEWLAMYRDHVPHT
jgi:hypothetical protein